MAEPMTATEDMTPPASASSSSSGDITIVAKFSKEKFIFSCLAPGTTIGALKEMIFERTAILPKRQKLVGLSLQSGGGPSALTDAHTLSALKVKKTKGKTNGDNAAIVHEFILMGTPEEKIFVDPSSRDNLPDVVDDFDLDFNAGSQEWLHHVAKEENLKHFTEKTVVHIMNEPRPGKPLLVLDLDHTLLDFSSKALTRDVSVNRVSIANAMKR